MQLSLKSLSLKTWAAAALAVGIVFGTVLACGGAAAQEYPAKDIHAICNFPAGSGADVFVRYFSEKLSALAGRPVIVTRNDYALGVFNGDIGIALPAPGGAMHVCFRMADGTLRTLSPAALPPHDTAFALTVHKSQGSEFDHAALVLPSAFGRMLSRELVYTAITRARSRVDVIGSAAVFAQAVGTPTRRDSGLATRIVEAAS